MTTPPHWQKSSFSGGGDGNACVELMDANGHIYLRESEDPTTQLRPAHNAVAHLLRTVKESRP
ncbi:DUF397 domain-containing protein [Streptomyces sp. NPDC005865]|uniref:DUF397 domain-containing protein n=1 Tax=Streptomyces sp. NPDC005865 TaxID=3155453 RepID=UPI0033E8D552